MVEALTVQAGAGTRAPSDIIAGDRQNTPASGGLLFDLVALAATLPGAGKMKTTPVLNSDAAALASEPHQPAVVGTIDPALTTDTVPSEPITDKAPVSVDALVAMDKAAKQGLEARIFVPKPETEWSIHILPTTPQPAAAPASPTDASPFSAIGPIPSGAEPAPSDALSGVAALSDSSATATGSETDYTDIPLPAHAIVAEIPPSTPVVGTAEAATTPAAPPEPLTAVDGALSSTAIENPVAPKPLAPVPTAALSPVPETSGQSNLGPVNGLTTQPVSLVASAPIGQQALTSSSPSTPKVVGPHSTQSPSSEEANTANPLLSGGLRLVHEPSPSLLHHDENPSSSPADRAPLAPTLNAPRTVAAAPSLVPTAPVAIEAVPTTRAPLTPSTAPLMAPLASAGLDPAAVTEPALPKAPASDPVPALPATVGPALNQTEPLPKKAGHKADHRLTQEADPINAETIPLNDAGIGMVASLPQGTNTASAPPLNTPPNDGNLLVASDDNRKPAQPRTLVKPTAFSLPPAKPGTPVRAADPAPATAKGALQDDTDGMATPTRETTSGLEQGDGAPSDQKQSGGQNQSGSQNPSEGKVQPEFASSASRNGPMSEGSMPSLIPSTFEQDLMTVAQGSAATSAATLDDLPSHVTVEAISLHATSKSHDADIPSAPAELSPPLIPPLVADEGDHTSGVIVDTTHFNASSSSAASSSTANGTSAASTALRTDSPSFIAQRDRAMEQQIIAAIRGGHDEIRLSLYPAQLGQVTINMALDGQKVRLGMKTSNREASTLLLGERQTLATSLGHEGFTLESFDVTDDQPREQSPDRQKPAISPAAVDQTTDSGFSLDITI